MENLKKKEKENIFKLQNVLPQVLACRWNEIFIDRYSHISGQPYMQGMPPPGRFWTFMHVPVNKNLR